MGGVIGNCNLLLRSAILALFIYIGHLWWAISLHKMSDLDIKESIRSVEEIAEIGDIYIWTLIKSLLTLLPETILCRNHLYRWHWLNSHQYCCKIRKATFQSKNRGPIERVGWACVKPLSSSKGLYYTSLGFLTSLYKGLNYLRISLGDEVVKPLYPKGRVSISRGLIKTFYGNSMQMLDHTTVPQ